MHAARRSKWLLGLLLSLLAIAALLRFVPGLQRPQIPSGLPPDLAETARQVAKIQASEEQAAKQFWAQELLAEQCGRTIEQLWDHLNRASNKWAALAEFPAREIVGPKLEAPESLSHGIQVFHQLGTTPAWTAASWRAFLTEAAAGGWEIVQTEFRHLQFETDTRGQPERSRFYCSAHLVNQGQTNRAILEGDLEVLWDPAWRDGQQAAVRRIEAHGWTVRQRRGEPGFREILSKQLSPMAGSYFIDPLILYDLDHDGLSEIILAAKNLVLKRRADGTFEERPLCRYPPGIIFTALLADFDGDGAVDFLCAKFDGLWLFKGSPEGTFDEPGRLVWAASPHLKYAQALTCGDIDGDGDLDVWLGQYKPPYDRGQMPTPYYDANDGYPSYLLRNDGRGNFTDVTTSAGLGLKRLRRVYSASLVDLNNDHHLDLVVASDFAGVDVYANDGRGHFTDVTRQWIPEPHGFGMAQTCADFDGDGQLDLLTIGMTVPVMERLWHMGASRPGFEKWLTMGKAMVYGNRLYQGQTNGPMRQTALNDSIARTGWSWGASAADLDNDGYPDLYVVNGHETKGSVRDYETEFWLHDIYVGNSRDNLPAFAYFQSRFAATRARGMSYGGYEKNRLFLNQHGQSFVEVAYLMGLGLEQDCRNVMADDLDGDGRMDLILTTFEVWPRQQQTVRMFRNTLEDTGNWIGFRLREEGAGLSPVGARVTVSYGGRKAVRTIVAGDSYRAQSAPSVHFGLGSAQEVETVEVLWSNKRFVRLTNPAINCYHGVSPE